MGGTADRLDGGDQRALLVGPQHPRGLGQAAGGHHLTLGLGEGSLVWAIGCYGLCDVSVCGEMPPRM